MRPVEDVALHNADRQTLENAQALCDAINSAPPSVRRSIRLYFDHLLREAGADELSLARESSQSAHRTTRNTRNTRNGISQKSTTTQDKRNHLCTNDCDPPGSGSSTGDRS